MSSPLERLAERYIKSFLSAKSTADQAPIAVASPETAEHGEGQGRAELEMRSTDGR